MHVATRLSLAHGQVLILSRQQGQSSDDSSLSLSQLLLWWGNTGQGSAQNCLSGGYPGAELLARMQYKCILMQHSNTCTLLSYEWW